MNAPVGFGIALTLIAGIMSGNCMLPLKFLRSWKWENAWLVFSIVSLVILPWLFAALLLHHLAETYAALTIRQFAVPFVLGAGWGVAQVLFGISVKRLGLGLAYAIIVGLGAMLGTLVPLFVQQRWLVSEHAIVFVLAGVVLMLAGIAISSWGGHLRERSSSLSAREVAGGSFLAALGLAVLCGLMAPMLNYSFAFGRDIANAAVLLGNSPAFSGYAVWPIALAGGFLPNIAYSIYLLNKNRTWSHFRESRIDVLLSSSMGVLWMGAFALYGMSAIYLGPLGTSIGWGLLQIFMIMTATLSGVLTGEWTHTLARARYLLYLGLLCLIGATVLLAMGNS